MRCATDRRWKALLNCSAQGYACFTFAGTAHHPNMSKCIQCPRKSRVPGSPKPNCEIQECGCFVVLVANRLLSSRSKLCTRKSTATPWHNRPSRTVHTRSSGCISGTTADMAPSRVAFQRKIQSFQSSVRQLFLLAAISALSFQR